MDDLEQLVGSSGEINEEYGGYSIVIKSKDFPLYDVCKALLASGFDIWITETKAQMILNAKPSVD
ncbi:MAG: hypothetical protein QXW91_04910 [Candidatus Nitrosotenuis sp.]